ncbi:MAG: hypothetical protein V4682_02955 [Patescibacteria group bacterium]
MDPIHALCEAAVASIAGDVNEGLIGTRNVGLHVVIMLADENRIVYEQGFGSHVSRTGRDYRSIAHEKAELAFEYRRSFNELMADDTIPGLSRDLHNGFFFESGLIVAIAGAGHLGNVAYGRRVLRILLESPLMLRVPEQATAA